MALGQAWTEEGVTRLARSAISGLVKDATKAIQFSPTSETLRLKALNESLRNRSCAIIGWGKAAKPIVEKLVREIPATKLIGATCIAPTKGGPAVRWLPADHPFLTMKSLSATKQMMSFIASVPRRATIIAVSTSGGSAMLWHPVDGVSPADKADAAEQIILSRLTCRQINNIRRCLSAVKGGRLLQSCASRSVITVIVNDDVLSAGSTILPALYVASGPTARHDGDYRRAIHDLKAAGVWANMPPSVRHHLTTKISITPRRPKPGRVIVLCDNYTLTHAVADLLTTSGVAVLERRDRVFGPWDVAAEALFSEFESFAKSNEGPVAYVAGGEVTCQAPIGRIGGRCQHVVASWIDPLSKIKGGTAVALGSDGVDFISGYAGAAINYNTLKACRERDLAPSRFLRSFDSGLLHQQLGTAIRSRRTNTNVGDVFVLARGPART